MIAKQIALLLIIVTLAAAAAKKDHNKHHNLVKTQSKSVLLTGTGGGCAENLNDQECAVVWHDGAFRDYRGSRNDVQNYYQQISSSYAKVMFCGNEVVGSYGGPYKWACLGWAIEKQLVIPEAYCCNSFAVVKHTSQGSEIEFFEDEADAQNTYNQISSSYAKAFVDHGAVTQLYGGDYKYVCLGEGPFTDAGQHCHQKKCAENLNDQECAVVWHNGAYQNYRGPRDAVQTYYNQISPNYAKVMFCGNEPVDSYGGPYKWACLGWAIERQWFIPKRYCCNSFAVVKHTSQGSEIEYFEDEATAQTTYNQISSSYAKAFVDHGDVTQLYGGDYKYVCLGEGPFTADGQKCDCALNENDQECGVVWHDGAFRDYRGSRADVQNYYNQISSSYAKVMFCGNNAVDSYGGPYKWACLGFAMEKQWFVPKQFCCNSYVVVKHTQNGSEIQYFEDESQAQNTYNQISSSYAKAFVDHGVVTQKYGGDYKYVCLGEGPFTANGQVCNK